MQLVLSGYFALWFSFSRSNIGVMQFYFLKVALFKCLRLFKTKNSRNGKRKDHLRCMGHLSVKPVF